jgi:hypothetical protein
MKNKSTKTMHLNLFLIALMFNLINISCQEQKIVTNDLLGKWNAYKVTTLDGGDGSDITLDGKPFSKSIMMNFVDSKNMFFSINGSEKYEIEYSLKDSVLMISHRKYTIKSLNDNLLILKEEKLAGNLIYLKKEDN